MTECLCRKWAPKLRRAAAVVRAPSLDCLPIFPPLVAATNKAEQKRNFTHSFQYWMGRISYNGDIKADREGARLPARLVNRSAFIFWGRFHARWQRNCRAKARFIGSPSEWGRCHSDSITLCNQRLLPKLRRQRRRQFKGAAASSFNTAVSFASL